MKKRLLTLMLAAAMVISAFAGCGGGDSQSSTPADSSGAESQQEEVKAETFTYFTTDPNFNWDNPVAEEITKKTGVILKPHLVIGDPTEAVSLMAASGQYDDLMGNPGGAMEMMLKVGGYVQLDDLIDQYGLHIKEFYGDYYNNLRYSVDDPHIYGLGIGASQVGETAPGYYWEVGFFFQNGALKELGYPEIKTPEDFEKALEDYLAKNPTTDDGQERIGLSLVTADGFRHQFSITQPAYFTHGLPRNGDWYYDKENDTYKWVYQQEFFKESLRWYNRLYNKGLIDPESFTQSYDAYLAKVASGRVVGLIDGFWEFNSALTQLRESNPENTYMAFAPVWDPDNMSWMADQPGDIVQKGGFSITTSCKNPEKLIKFFDFLASEEGQILTEQGIEGVNYTIGEDGEFVRNPDDVEWDKKADGTFPQQTGVKFYTGGIGDWLHRPNGWKTSTGATLRTNDYSAAADGYSQPEKDSLAQYGFEYFTDIFPHPIDMPVRPEGKAESLVCGATEETSVARQKINDMVLPHMAEAIMCSPEEFDTVWDGFMTDMEASGAQLVEDEINQSYQDKKTMLSD